MKTSLKTLLLIIIVGMKSQAGAVGFTDPRALSMTPEAAGVSAPVSASSDVSFGLLTPSTESQAGRSGAKMPLDPADLSHASLKVGPVPAKAGEPLRLKLPAAAEHIDLILYTADMQVAGRTEARGQSTVDFTQTAGLATGVYIARVVMDNNGVRSQSIQKIIITR